MKILRSICMAFFAIGIGIGGLAWAQEGPKEAIGFVLNDVSGNPISMDDYFGKQPVLLSFFATWCPACNEEVPRLNKFNENYGKGVAIFAISVREGTAKVKRFIKRHNITYRVLLDTDGRVAEKYQIRGIPTIISIDANKTIVYYGHDLEEAKKRFGKIIYKVGANEIGKEVVCPVTGERFKVVETTVATVHKGRIFYFCCAECFNAFFNDIDRYSSKAFR